MLQSSTIRPGRALIPLFAVLTCPSVSAEIGWEGGVTAVYQYADDNRADPELTISADLFATIEQPEGVWLVYVEGSTAPDADGVSAFYPTANADAGSVLNRDGDGGLQISEFNYTFFLDNGSNFAVGLIDPSAWLDRSRITNDENTHFLNGNFVNNATIEFPDYTLGAVLRVPQSGSRPELTLVAASSAGIADVPDRSYQDLLDLTDENRGAFVGLGGGWQRERTVIRAGAWVRTDDHVVSGEPDSADKNYGAYGVFGWHNDADAVNVRFGFANEDVSVATLFAAAAYQRTMQRGLFGIGIARTAVASTFRQADLVDVTHAEVFFRISLGGSGHLTPSLQYAENPGFAPSGSVDSASAVIASLRFRWSF